MSEIWAWLRGKGRVTYNVPPQESPGVSKLAALMGVDIRLSELAGIPPWERTEEQWDELDRLLDRRARLTSDLRPVPVVPGRVDSIIDNYGENPW
jgi:hypothetical protein